MKRLYILCKWPSFIAKNDKDVLTSKKGLKGLSVELIPPHTHTEHLSDQGSTLEELGSIGSPFLFENLKFRY